MEATTPRPRFVIAVDNSVRGALDTARQAGAQLASIAQERVMVAALTSSAFRQVQAQLRQGGGMVYGEEIQPAPKASAAPMSAAPFVWLDDGRPDWGSMWQGFCELALFGGPPHRGDEQALHARTAPATAPDDSMVDEIRRGILETTGLSSELAESGWLSVFCDSPKMAAWLCATILLENVDARCDGSRLLVPAAPDFEMKDQVKSVITVVAKTHHYWQAHLDSAAASQTTSA